MGGGQGSRAANGLNCCKNTDTAKLYVEIGYTSLDVEPEGQLTFTVSGAESLCDGENFEWALQSTQGSISATTGLEITYTAPVGGAECDPTADLVLYCNGVQADFVTVQVNPCPPTVSIGYTSQQMDVNGEQTLNATPSGSGCGAPVYDWSITAGNGTLSASQGASVVYTAPATNAECAGNPTIELSCGGVLLDTLQMAVTAAVGGVASYDCVNAATSFPVCGNYCHCSKSFDCHGVATGGLTLNECAFAFGDVTHVEGSWQTCAQVSKIEGFNQDARTPTMKTNGCCPYLLL